MTTDYYIPDETLELIADAILNARDFCGDEREAALDAAYELGVPATHADKAARIARFRANATWNQCQRAAGVPAKYRMA
jgi:hypothetical protein